MGEPGKYDAACTKAREMTDADTVLLVVIGGRHGSGFSVQSHDPYHAEMLPTLLRTLADQMDRNAARVAS